MVKWYKPLVAVYSNSTLKVWNFIKKLNVLKKNFLLDNFSWGFFNINLFQNNIQNRFVVPFGIIFRFKITKSNLFKINHNPDLKNWPHTVVMENNYWYGQLIIFQRKCTYWFSSTIVSFLNKYSDPWLRFTLKHSGLFSWEKVKIRAFHLNP